MNNRTRARLLSGILKRMLVWSVVGLTPGLMAAEQNDSEKMLQNKEHINYEAEEKALDQKVRNASKSELAKDFNQAINEYVEAKKGFDKLYKQCGQARFQTKSEKCIRGISRTYYYWASDIYKEAMKSANVADYDSAIEKCKKAIEVYPACKERMEQVIKELESMKKGEDIRSKLKDAQRDADEIREIQILLRQGQVLYQTRQYDKAKTKYEEVLLKDPYNEDAIKMLHQIHLKMQKDGLLRQGLTRNARNAASQWEMVMPLINRDANSQIPEEGVSKVNSNSKIQDKLKNIIIDNIQFEEVQIATAIKYLRDQSREKDPEKIGVNFVLRGKINRASGDEAEEDSKETDNKNSKDNKKEGGGEVEALTMVVDHIPLETAIKYICKLVNLRYRVDENAVVIASSEVQLDDVQTKVYPVDKSHIKLAEGQSIQDYLTERGMTFRGGASAVYKESIGRLIVTNTPKELQNFEVNFLEKLNQVDIQVLIQTKFIQVQLNDLEQLGFKYTLSRANSNVKYVSADNSRLVTLAPGESVTPDYIANVFQANTENSSLRSYMGTTQAGSTLKNDQTSDIYYMKAPLQQSSTTYSLGNNAMIRTFDNAGSLSQENTDNYGKELSFNTWGENGYAFNAEVYALDQADSSDVLSCPRVTTVPETQAKIQLVKEQYFPTDWDEAEYTIMGNNVPVFTGSVPNLDEETETGISLEVTPVVDPADNYSSILVLMRPMVRTFTGWDDYSYEVPMKLNDNSPSVNIKNTMKMPKLEQRTVDTQATCSDNGTIVLGGMIRDEVSILDDQYPILGDLPLVGRLFQSKGRNAEKYNLLIFLTCRLVKPDGSPLRARDDDQGLPSFKY